MKRTQPHGFTLIELMITVVIIGILAAVAYPSYTRYVAQARRADGQIALTQLAADQEKFFSDCSRYATSITNSRDCTNLGLGKTSSSSKDGYYTLSLNATATTFTLTATPQGTQAANDTECTTLTLTHQGTKGATGSNPANCWKR